MPVAQSEGFMHRVLLLGAGKMGETIAHFLSSTNEYELLIGDASEAARERVARISGVTTVEVEAGSTDAVASVLSNHPRDIVISACSFDVNVAIATAALQCGVSYFDLTEDVQTTRAIKSLADRAGPNQIFMPQCGLAPGFVAISGFDLTRQFDKLESLHLRVGALPIFPTNAMKYNLTWSTDGLINEYGNPCDAIYQGRHIDVLPLEGLEHFSLDGNDYEAFNTSGAIGTLCETLEGQVQSLDYKTVRYRGHRDLIAFLMNELRLNSRRALLKDILETSIPMTPQDLVLIFCTAAGLKGGRLTQITDARKIYHGEFLGYRASAIQITTAAAMCAVVDLHASGALPVRSGFVRQEQVPLAMFLSNRFGRAYAGADAISSNVRFEPWTRIPPKPSAAS
jgi:saccharopine dehydrogenase-like NADP-dependent oxidoreductase